MFLQFFLCYLQLVLKFWRYSANKQNPYTIFFNSSEFDRVHLHVCAIRITSMWRVNTCNVIFFIFCMCMNKKRTYINRSVCAACTNQYFVYVSHRRTNYNHYSYLQQVTWVLKRFSEKIWYSPVCSFCPLS